MNWGEWSLLACLNLKIIVLQLLLNYFGGFEFCLILISRLFLIFRSPRSRRRLIVSRARTPVTKPKKSRLRKMRSLMHGNDSTGA